jgi:hypothetical protein
MTETTYRPARRSLVRSLTVKTALTTTIVLALCVFGCGSRDDRVPLLTDASDPGGACWLLHQVADVISDPTTGTPSIGPGTPLKWPRGYTARRGGTQVQVLSQAGTVVLTTGGRYELCPTPDTDYTKPLAEWVIGGATPCNDTLTSQCELRGIVPD